MRSFYVYLYTDERIAPWRQRVSAHDLDQAVDVARADVPAMLEFLRLKNADLKPSGVFIGEGMGAARRLTLPEGKSARVIMPERPDIFGTLETKFVATSRATAVLRGRYWWSK
jgi:hypothetical protein